MVELEAEWAVESMVWLVVLLMVELAVWSVAASWVELSGE